LFVAVLLPGCLTAQSSSTAGPLSPGTRVRVSTVDAPSALRIGTVSAASTDSLWFFADGAASVVALPYRGIAQLDVRLVRHANARKGAGIGALVGAGTGIILAFASGDDKGWIGFSARYKAVVGGISLGALGALVGGLVGDSRDTEEWRPIRVLPRASASPRPSLGFRVSMALP
jgi:hypothetical protein